MATRTRSLDEAARNARWSLAELGREVRNARIRRGSTQRQVAVRLGTSVSQVSRLERGLAPRLTVASAFRLAAAVGLRGYLRAFPGGRDLLDQPQLALLERLRGRAAPAWRWRLEVPIPTPGDLRAVDAVLTNGDCVIAIEAITRLADVQAQVRAAQVKARDLGATRLLLLLAATSANRRALRAAQPLIEAAFPMTTRAALTSLAAGRDPGADALVLL